MSAFYIDKTPKEKYRICLNDEVYDFFKNKLNGGSYNTLAARLLGLSYVDYLKMCVQDYEGTLYGKNGYSNVSWNEVNDKLEGLINELNKRWNKFLVHWRNNL